MQILPSWVLLGMNDKFCRLPSLMVNQCTVWYLLCPQRQGLWLLLCWMLLVLSHLCIYKEIKEICPTYTILLDNNEQEVFFIIYHTNPRFSPIFMTVNYFFMWSIWVSNALTTLIASDGSVPAIAAFLAAVKLSTWERSTLFMYVLYLVQRTRLCKS